MRFRPWAPSKQPDPLANRESGQALLELALVVPILILLVMAIFQFAFVIESQMGLTNAVREAARRVAAVEPNAAPVWTGAGSMTEWVEGELCETTAPCAGGLLEQNVQAFDGNRLTTDPPVVTFCSYQLTNAVGASVTQYRVQVDVTYEHPVFFGPLAFATDLVDGSPNNNAWDLSASAQMRLEHMASPLWAVSDPGGCPA